MSEELKKYFKTMFSNVDKDIVLDDDQIAAILNDDKYTLILAGAGTGKTTTMVAKVKYLVDIKKVDPSKILVISYTKKAVQELEELIVDQFGINAEVSTFHSLAYKYVRNIFKNRKCVIIDYNDKEEIFYNYINKIFSQKRIENLISIFGEDRLKLPNYYYGKYFKQHYMEFNSYDEFFEKYKRYKLNEAKQKGIRKTIDEWVDKKLKSDYPTTIKGELVKSVSEAVIANFLFVNGIDYAYEKVYDEIMEDRKVYKPDFTLELASQKIYLQYFGLNDKKYNKIKDKKIKFHEKYKNEFIYIENESVDEILIQLDLELKMHGFRYKKRSYAEIYNQILDNNKLSQIYKLKNLFYSSIEQIKENICRERYLDIANNYIKKLGPEEKKIAMEQFKYINEFYKFYQSKIITPDIYGFDYADLIYYSNKYMKEFLNLESYDYIIIDEYQDISDGEYELARNTSNKTNAKVFAVGDDWQSIYSFRGSNIKYITKFDQYFEKPTIMSIKQTYRNSQELINITSSFIRENKDQLDKKMLSYKHLSHPINFKIYDDRVIDEFGAGSVDESIEYKTLKELILEIHNKYPEHNILILGRNNSMINNCFKFDNDFIDDLGSKIRLSSVKDLKLEGMTIHKAKGLTYDEVIIIGMNKEFPNPEHTTYWLQDLFKPQKMNESIDFAEERRILYVALTRTRNNVYILANRNAKNRSRFVDELIKICKEEKANV